MILNNCADFPSIDPKKLQVKIGDFKSNRCWCYVSQEIKEELAQYAHFTIGIGGDGLSLCVNMETDNAVGQFLRKAKSDRNALLEILKKLDEDYFLEIYERAPPPESPRLPHYKWEWYPLCRVYASYIDDDGLTFMIQQIEKLQHSAVRLYCVDYSRDNEIIYSPELVEDIFQRLKESQNFYGWVRQ